MSDAVVNQSKTIDQLDPIPQEIDKQAFIDSAFVPIRGEVNGTKTTFKVTGSDLAASGENKIDSISVNGTAVEPDASKNVNIQVPNADNSTIVNDNGVLSVADPVPDTTDNTKRILTTDKDGNIVWGYPEGDYIMVDDDGDVVIVPPNGLRAIYYDSSSGGYGIRTDEETITEANFGTEDNPVHKLAVMNPVPAPAANHADAGKVLTVKTVDNIDEIVWDAPQGGGGIELPSMQRPTSSGGQYYIPIFVNPGTYAPHNHNISEQKIEWVNMSNITADGHPIDW